MSDVFPAFVLFNESSLSFAYHPIFVNHLLSRDFNAFFSISSTCKISFFSISSFYGDHCLVSCFLSNVPPPLCKRFPHIISKPDVTGYKLFSGSLTDIFLL